MSEESLGRNLTLLQFFYIEFFGSFIPGVVATGSVLVLIFESLYTFGILDPRIIAHIGDRNVRYFGIPLFFIGAYAIGAIVYRRPHDALDNISSWKLWESETNEGRKKRAISFSGPPPIPPFVVAMKAIVRFILRFFFLWHLYGFVLYCLAPEKQIARIMKAADYRRFRLAANLRFATFRVSQSKWLAHLPTRRLSLKTVLQLLYVHAVVCINLFCLDCSLFQNGGNPNNTGRNRRQTFSLANLLGKYTNFAIDYPYPFLRRYIAYRGAHHLLDYVSWCKNASNATVKSPGKTFINVIKQRLRASTKTELLRDMVRNEGHARLLSSLWYILRFLLFFMIVLNFAILAHRCFSERTQISISHILFNIRKLVSSYPQHYVLTLTACFIIWYLKRSIEIGFHYVRLRELLMTIESAYICQNSEPSTQSVNFNDIVRKGQQFKIQYCINCNQCPASSASQ